MTVADRNTRFSYWRIDFLKILTVTKKSKGLFYIFIFFTFHQAFIFKKGKFSREITKSKQSLHIPLCPVQICKRNPGLGLEDLGNPLVGEKSIALNDAKQKSSC
jgi:hypothetical protein